jgi:uncharacterized protein (DUF3820 family)
MQSQSHLPLRTETRYSPYRRARNSVSSPDSRGEVDNPWKGNTETYHLSFGRFKGKTLESLDKEGKGWYIRWLTRKDVAKAYPYLALALSKYITVPELETEGLTVEDSKLPDFRLKNISNRNKNAPARIQVSPPYKIDFGKYKGKGKTL